MAALSQVAGATVPVIITPPPPSGREKAPARALRPEPHDDTPSEHSRDPRGFSEEEQQRVAELKARDREVRTHEQAHKNAGGPHAGAPSYEYTRGPDGNQYAVSGEVSIDASPVAGNPSATISKMEIVIRAALAPAEPSGQDMKVAAQARAAKIKAQTELRRENAEGQSQGFAALRQRLGLEESVDGLTPANKATRAYQNLQDLLDRPAENLVSFAA